MWIDEGSSATFTGLIQMASPIDVVDFFSFCMQKLYAHRSKSAHETSTARSAFHSNGDASGRTMEIESSYIFS